MTTDTHTDWMKVSATLSGRLSAARATLAKILKTEHTDPNALEHVRKLAELFMRHPNRHEGIHNVSWCCDKCYRPFDDQARTIENQRIIMGALVEQTEKLRAEVHHAPRVVEAERLGRQAARIGNPIQACPYHPEGSTVHDPDDVELGMVWRNAWMTEYERMLMDDVVAAVGRHRATLTRQTATEVEEAYDKLMDLREHI